MTGTDTAPRRTPSVSELQAALEAARNGQFASPGAAAATPAAPAPPTARPSALPAETALLDEQPAPPLDRIAAPPPPPATAHQMATTRPSGSGTWLLGTHGGSGVRCLATVLPGTRWAGRAWPPAPDTPAGREPVVLVCRSSHRGLTSAQDHARAYRDSGPDGIAGHLQLVGVIICADAPGRTPPALRRLEKLLSGAVPIIGHAPWEPTWRLGPPVVAAGDIEPLPWVTKLARALDDTLARVAEQGAGPVSGRGSVPA